MKNGVFVIAIVCSALPCGGQDVTPTPIPGDVNHDGVVNHEDLLILQANWHVGEKRTPTPTPQTITIAIPGDLPSQLTGKVKTLEMVLIPPGTFTMGFPPEEASSDFIDVEHEVTIAKPYYIGKYEVTEAQWSFVVEGSTTLSSLSAMNRARMGPTWEGCQTFIDKLNAMGLGRFRLPTEAEWEYACRAGTTTRYSFGDALECSQEDEYCELFDRHMWWGGNYKPGTNTDGSKEVGLKLPNPWGLYDMHGNVEEWCQDWHAPYGWEPQVDPTGPTEGSERVSRGGSWLLDASRCRSADRSIVHPVYRHYSLGFRLVRDYP